MVRIPRLDLHAVGGPGDVAQPSSERPAVMIGVPQCREELEHIISWGGESGFAQLKPSGGVGGISCFTSLTKHCLENSTYTLKRIQAAYIHDFFDF